ncbi:MAG: YjfB family protein [Pseudomonadota bacterium]
MDVSAIASAAIALSQARVADAAGTLVLTKALDIQAASALQLLQAIPTPAPAKPSGTHLIDTYA